MKLSVQPLVMTFAARYIGASYRDYVSDYRVLVEGQTAVARDFGLDILSVCSDPVRELADCGGALVWFEDAPPAPDPDHHFLADLRDLASLSLPDPVAPGRMLDRVLAVEVLSHRTLPVLGWVEGPISEAAVMRGLTTLMEDLLDEPAAVEELFEFSTDMAIAFARTQIDAGARWIGFGDAPASLVGPEHYERHVLPHERRLVEAIQRMGAQVRMHVCGNTTAILPLMAQTGADMIDIDAPTDWSRACAAIPPPTWLLGNLDPVRDILQGTPDSIHSRLRACRDAAGDRYVVGAGCEIPPATPCANLRSLAQFAAA